MDTRNGDRLPVGNRGGCEREEEGSSGDINSDYQHQNLMQFIAQAICLKKYGKHLAEQVFVEIARLIIEDTVDSAKLLEKARMTQMIDVKEKGQKLYTCAPTWEELYEE